MKKKLYALLFVAILILYGCNSNQTTSTNSDSFDSIPLLGNENKSKQPETAELNTFFTYFSACNTSPFKEGEASDETLIYFGVYFNYRNYQKELFHEAKQGMVGINKQAVADTVSKYFGKEIKTHKSVDEIKYKNNVYQIVDASGEVFNFSQVSKITENENDEYTIELTVFSASSGWTGDLNAKPETWAKESPDDFPIESKKMTAKIKHIQTNGKSHFILVEYLD